MGSVEGLLKQFPQKYRNWARQEALGTLSSKLNTQDLFFDLIANKWKWVQAQDPLEIMQGLNTKKVIKQTSKKITLSTRSGQTYTLTKEKGVWKIASFEGMISSYIQTLEDNKDVIQENLKELKHRKRLRLPLPSSVAKSRKP